MWVLPGWHFSLWCVCHEDHLQGRPVGVEHGCHHHERIYSRNARLGRVSARIHRGMFAATVAGVRGRAFVCVCMIVCSYRCGCAWPCICVRVHDCVQLPLRVCVAVHLCACA